ncbi:hypothetical protein ACC728_39095, partial [Rhizobium ruizarguesonis]
HVLQVPAFALYRQDRDCKINDTWPVASWSSLDYGGRWKAMNYLVKRFFQPVAVAAIPSDEGKTIRFSLVNDTLGDVSVDL